MPLPLDAIGPTAIVTAVVAAFFFALAAHVLTEMRRAHERRKPPRGVRG